MAFTKNNIYIINVFFMVMRFIFPNFFFSSNPSPIYIIVEIILSIMYFIPLVYRKIRAQDFFLDDYIYPSQYGKKEKKNLNFILLGISLGLILILIYFLFIRPIGDPLWFRILGLFTGILIYTTLVLIFKKEESTDDNIVY